MDEKTSRVQLIKLIILVVVIMAGISFRYFYNAGTRLDQPIRGDGWQYLMYSKNLLEHSTFSKESGTNSPSPDSYWAPGYPIFLALVTKTSEILHTEFYTTFMHSQLILGGLTILFTCLLANSFLPGFWPILPALLVAFSPHLISIGSNLLSETLTGFLLVAGLYFCVSGIKSANSAKVCVAGCFFALNYMTNPVTLVTAPLIAILICFKSQQGKQSASIRPCKLAAILVTPLVITVSLWGIRGAINVPEDAPSSSSRLIINLVQGTLPDFHEYWRTNEKKANDLIKYELAVTNTSYTGFIKLFGNKLISDPKNMLTWYLVTKPVLLWEWNIRVGMGDIYIYPVFYSLYDTSSAARITYSLMKAIHFWILGCAVLSIVYILRNGKQLSWIAGTIYFSTLTISAIYVIAQSEPRYSIPMRPEMYMLGTYFIWQTLLQYKKYLSNNSR